MSVLTSRDLLLLPQATPNAPPRVTSTHMPAALCERLIQLCHQFQQIISDNGNSMDCRMKRRTIWIEISKQLNTEFSVEFTPDQYKKKYQNLKTALKTKILNLRSSPDSRRDSATAATSSNVVNSSDAARQLMRSTPSPSESKATIAQQSGSQIDVQSLLVKFFDQNDHLTGNSPEGESSSAPPIEVHSAPSNAADVVHSSSSASPDEDPTRLFCLSLTDPLHKIRVSNPSKYIHLKRTITNLVFDAELEILGSPMESE